MQDHRGSISDAEVLAVCRGIDDATDQPVVCLAVRPVTGSGWGCINFSLTVENAHSLLERLAWVLKASPSISGERAAEDWQDGGHTTRP